MGWSGVKGEALSLVTGLFSRLANGYRLAAPRQPEAPGARCARKAVAWGHFPTPHLLSPSCSQLSPPLFSLPPMLALCFQPRDLALAVSDAFPCCREMKQMEKGRGCPFSPLMSLRFWWVLGLAHPEGSLHQVTTPSMTPCAWCV